MPVCDGGGTCTTEVPWRIQKAALQLGDGTVPFKSDDVATALVAELTALGFADLARTVAPKKGDVPFKNLCSKCWLIEAKAWGNPSDYAPARAKTTAKGVYFQVMVDDFKDSAKKFSAQGILSCTVHEMLHFWSFHSVGLQDLKGQANISDIDEAVTDDLAYPMFKRLFHGKAGMSHYITPYKDYVKWVDAANTAFLALGPAKFMKNQGGARDKLPTALKTFFEIPANQDVAAPNQVRVKAEVTPILKKVLRHLTYEWYLKGPTTAVEGAPGDKKAAAFFSDNGIKNFVNVSKAFPGYDGTNTPHAI